MAPYNLAALRFNFAAVARQAALIDFSRRIHQGGATDDNLMSRARDR